MKKGSLIPILIGIAIILVAGMYLQNRYDVFSIKAGQNSYRLSCEDTLNNFYRGAEPGECVAYALGANRLSYKGHPETLYKIVSVSERKSSCGPIVPSRPDGCYTWCDVEVSHDYEDTLQCEVAKSPFGDLECDGGYCDYVGSIQIPDSCGAGESICLSDTTYAKCLANEKFSGILACPSGNICTDGTCESSDEVPRCPNNKILCGDKTCQTSCSGHGVTPEVPYGPTCSFLQKYENGKCVYDMTLWYILGGVIGLVLLVSLIGKK